MHGKQDIKNSVCSVSRVVRALGFYWEFENGKVEGEAMKRDDGPFVTKK
jgi:hypothetical protein